MEIKVLASGSTGNSYRVSDGETTLLLDAGLTARELMIKLQFRLSSLSGCLISHNHQDHSKAAADLADMGVDIYTATGTIDACKLTGHRIHELQALQEVTIGTLKVLPFDVAHDAPQPVGYLLSSTLTGAKLLYFTDTYYIKYRFQGLTHIMCECNYSKEALQYSIDAGYIPIEMVSRIVKSHMSLDHLIEMLKANDLSKVKQIYLMHLSRNNSNEKYFKKEIQKVSGAEVYVC